MVESHLRKRERSFNIKTLGPRSGLKSFKSDLMSFRNRSRIKSEVLCIRP